MALPEGVSGASDGFLVDSLTGVLLTEAVHKTHQYLASIIVDMAHGAGWLPARIRSRHLHLAIIPLQSLTSYENDEKT